MSASTQPDAKLFAASMERVVSVISGEDREPTRIAAYLESLGAKSVQDLKDLASHEYVRGSIDQSFLVSYSDDEIPTHETLKPIEQVRVLRFFTWVARHVNIRTAHIANVTEADISEAVQKDIEEKKSQATGTITPTSPYR